MVSRSKRKTLEDTAHHNGSSGIPTLRSLENPAFDRSMSQRTSWNSGVRPKRATLSISSIRIAFMTLLLCQCGLRSHRPNKETERLQPRPPKFQSFLMRSFFSSPERPCGVHFWPVQDRSEATAPGTMHLTRLLQGAPSEVRIAPAVRCRELEVKRRVHGSHMVRKEEQITTNPSVCQ